MSEQDRTFLSEAQNKIHPAMQYTDWIIDISSPVEKSILFKGKKAVSVPPSLEDFAIQFSDKIKTDHQYRVSNSLVIYVDNIKFRLEKMGEYRYAARRIVQSILNFNALGIKEGYQRALKSPELMRTGGLVIFCGQPGSGKSSSIAATIKERLETLGGFCLTLEDPIEYALHGQHGEGWCEQRDVSDIGYAKGIISSLRCFPSQNPSMLMLGEIRDSETAMELLRVAIDGHLVITTMHAVDIISAIKRIIYLARSASDDTEARSLLASSLKLVIHQRLDGGLLQMNALKCNDVVSSMINHNTLDSLKDEIMRSNQKIMTGAF